MYNTAEQPKNYDFVPFPASVKNTYITDMKKRRGNNSGYAEIEITTVDNLYIGSGFSHYEAGKGILSETQKIIPASSLKGSVRQIARAVSDGCIPQDKMEIPVFDRKGDTVKEVRRGITVNKAEKKPPLLTAKQRKKCDVKDKTEICIICDMFGTMSLGSKVRFTDLKAEKCPTETVKMPQQFSPNTASDDYWYIGDDNKPYYKGYKFYYTYCEPREVQRNETVSVIRKNVTFKGRVYFNDLFDDQLELLLYSLGVGKNISLKLGGYKADGFGTVKTSCTELIVNDKKRNAYELANKYAKDNADILEEIEDILCYRER
ncbi:MAG: hypothetical protein IJZ65_04910 [Ruminiclostridium sp.]|nr:hypothetical protein [Ruminiclostridium sp.]MBQ8841954.1 hypothetical protein [Ruminiclostridium sp.]